MICTRYVNYLVGDVKANPRDFYRYINSQKKGIPPLKKRQGSGLCPDRFRESKLIQWPVHGCVYQN